MANCVSDSPGDLLTSIVFLLLAATLSCGSIYVFCKHIQSHKRNHNKQNSSLMFWVGLFFNITIIISATNSIIGTIIVISSCYKVSNIGDRISTATYSLQWYGLTLTLFARIYSVFKGSTYRLSSCTVYTVCSYFVIMAIPIISGFLPIWTGPDRYAVFFTMIGLMFLSGLSYVIWITFFFIYKLYKVFKYASDDSSLLAVITRNTLLATISILATFIAIFIWTIVVSRGTATAGGYMTPRRYIFYFGFLLDTYTNFVCIGLSYKLFTPYYDKLCGSIDQKCRFCCLNCVRKSQNETYIEEVTMDKVVSASDEDIIVDTK
eukprot:210918_1